jgi:hypothetical protein
VAPFEILRGWRRSGSVSMVRRVRRGLLAGIAFMLLGASLLVGCTATDAPGVSAHTAKASAGGRPTGAIESSPTSGTSLASEFAYLPPAGTVMGTGTLADVEGHATGDVSVSVASDLRFQVAISSFSTTAGPGLTAALSVDRFGPTAGAPTVPAPDDPVGDIETNSGNPVLPFPSSGRRDRGNLAYFNSVELVSEGTVYAAAPITWSIPNFYPSLALKDSGPTPFARGEVTFYEGQLAGYVVWGNDNSQAVATRFGITQDQLFYLNPQLRRGDTELLRDTTLNLSVAYR